MFYQPCMMSDTMAATPYTLQNLLDALNRISPFALAESWDNVGLMVGDPNQQVSGILVGLDPTEALLAEALSNGANTIITHHPLLFHPLQSIRTDQPLGRLLAKALQNNIAIVACHTNLDVISTGVNDILAARLDIDNTEPLTNSTGPDAAADCGFGRIGALAAPLPGPEFIEKTMRALDTPALLVAGQVPEQITMVAVCGGSGSDLAEQALSKGAQVYITGEVKHSVARWAEAAGLCIIDASHFATENLIIPELVAMLQTHFSENSIPVPVQMTEQQRSPFTVYCQNEPSGNLAD